MTNTYGVVIKFHNALMFTLHVPLPRHLWSRCCCNDHTQIAITLGLEKYHQANCLATSPQRSIAASSLIAQPTDDCNAQPPLLMCLLQLIKAPVASKKSTQAAARGCARSGISDVLPPPTAYVSPMSNPSFDHSYELPLRRNLLLLLDLLGLLRFIAGVILDRLGVAPCQGEVHLPGQALGGVGEHANDVDLERLLEARLWETVTRSLTAPRYRRRRVAPAQPADVQLDAEGDAEGAAVCAICLAGLEQGDFQAVVELCGCSHAFHAACIDAWVRSGDGAATCPLCRAPMLPTAWDDEQSSSGARPGD